MPDDALSFPTAIVPTRPGGTAVERARKYMRAFGDPMGVLFTDMKTATREVNVYGQDGSVTTLEAPDRAVRRECAKELMPYIYPKLRASEVSLGAGGGAQGVSITINIGGAPVAPPQDPVAQAIDVTPADDPLA